MSVPRHLHPYARPARKEFVKIVRGKGALVYDDTGREYIDGMASLWYANVGHGRPEMADAISKQAREIAAYHTFDIFSNAPSDELAVRLSELVPVDDPRVFFTTSGSEAVDSAIKLARIAHARAGRTDRKLIISRERGYHGVTYGGMSAQGLPANQEGFGPLVGGFVCLAADDIDVMKRFLLERGDEIAAVITEPVQGAGGVYPPPDGYMSELRALCDQCGAYLVLDEVICNFGRLGRWFGADFYGVRPDMITFAKGVTSGYVPLGGVVVGQAVRAPLEADESFLLRHGHTYSGHPLACAAGLMAMQITKDEDLIERATEVGKRLGAGLDSLAAEGLADEMRGVGAIRALGLREDQDAVALRHELMDRNVIVRPIGDATLAFCPPFVITDEQIDRLVEATRAALSV